MFRDGLFWCRQLFTLAFGEKRHKHEFQLGAKQLPTHAIQKEVNGMVHQGRHLVIL